MKRIFLPLFSSIVLIFNLLNIISCKEREETVNCFPNSQIYITSLLPNENNDLITKSWTYIDRDGAGTRGLIVVKTGDGIYKAYDRNAPHICPDLNTTLIVEYPYVICPKDNAKWYIRTGEMMEVSKLPLKSYYCVVTNNSLSIYN